MKPERKGVFLNFQLENQRDYERKHIASDGYQNPNPAEMGLKHLQVTSIFTTRQIK